MHLRLFAHLQEGPPPAAETLFALDGRGVLSHRSRSSGSKWVATESGQVYATGNRVDQTEIPDYFG
jgi:hypothetical protein